MKQRQREPGLGFNDHGWLIAADGNDVWGTDLCLHLVALLLEE